MEGLLVCLGVGIKVFVAIEALPRTTHLAIVFGGGVSSPSICSMLSIAAEAVSATLSFSGSSCMRTLDMAAGRPIVWPTAGAWLST